jgi:hypothetical protein
MNKTSGIDLKYSSGDLIDNLHNQNHLVLPKKSSLSRKQILAQLRVRPTFDPLEADFTQTVKIPFRENKVDSEQPNPFEVSIHDTPAEFLIKAQSTQSTQAPFEIRITGDKNLKKLRAQFGTRYQQVVDSLRIMNEQLALLNPTSVQR